MPPTVSLPYQCPGERYAISRPTHLARLASGYQGCEACPHRHETGGIAAAPRPRRALSDIAVFQTDRIVASERDVDGRSQLMRAVGALAELLWEQHPWTLPATDWDTAHRHVPAGPAICLGYDESVLARRAVMDVERFLLRSGARVILVGAVSRPVLDSATAESRSVAGLYVESGGSPSVTSLSVTDAQGIAWSFPGQWEAVAERMEMSPGRSLRSGGMVVSVDLRDRYLTALLTSFESCGPMSIAAAGMPALLRSTWNIVSAASGVTLVPVDVPVRLAGEEPDIGCVRAVMDVVVSQQLAGGVIFDSDGRRLWGLDGRTGLMSAREAASAVATRLAFQSDRPLRAVAYESSMWLDLTSPRTSMSFCEGSSESLGRAMAANQAQLGADGVGRLWIGKPGMHLRCDALLTLAHLIQFWRSHH
jgi:hypothetical protein